MDGNNIQCSRKLDLALVWENGRGQQLSAGLVEQTNERVVFARGGKLYTQR